MNNQFRETRKLYINYLQYTKPLSYVEWVALPEDHKAAALFVQYFDQIELAWYKAKSFFTSEEDGVYTVMQYLVKNVDKIKNDPKRFSESYIYKIAYNCLYCICHDPITERIRWETTVSNIVPTAEGDLDLFDTTVSIHSEVEIQYERNRFWDIINNLDPKARKVVNNILNGAPLGKYSPKSTWAEEEKDLRDVQVSRVEAEAIKQRLAKVLAEFADLL